MTPLMTAQEVEDLIHAGFNFAERVAHVEEVVPGVVRIRTPYRPSMLRPGNVISGPTLFTAADIAMYALVLSHIGPQLMAVTSNLNMNFLAKGRPGDVISVARMLKLGRRFAVMEVALSTSADTDTLVAHATGTYALPLP